MVDHGSQWSSDHHFHLGLRIEIICIFCSTVLYKFKETKSVDDVLPLNMHCKFQ